MYKISKEFTFSMGHRLSHHLGACKHIHGHNYKVIVGLKSKTLNSHGMIIDFSQLKSIVTEYLDIMDHALMINNVDLHLIKKMKETLPELKVLSMPYEPTAENLSKNIYMYLFVKLQPSIEMDYVTVYETDTSNATYTKN